MCEVFMNKKSTQSQSQSQSATGNQDKNPAKKENQQQSQSQTASAATNKSTGKDTLQKPAKTCRNLQKPPWYHVVYTRRGRQPFSRPPLIDIQYFRTVLESRRRIF